MRSLLKTLGWMTLVLTAVLVTRTLLAPSIQLEVTPVDVLPLDQHQIAGNLSAAVQLKTLSEQSSLNDPEPSLSTFFELHDLLRVTYPRVHTQLSAQTLGGASLLYRWQGSDPSLKPALFLAHQDVVPADEATLKQWTFPPFSGAIEEGFIWGRGTLDFKFGVIGWLEACEHLLASGFKPQRTLYFAFGHDEEIMGKQGAQTIAHHFKQQGVHFAMVLDEGLPITHDIMPGLPAPLALIALAEKGYVTLELSVEAEGGHSSMPPPHTAVGVLAKAITRIEDNPMPAHTSPPTEALFAAVGPELPFAKRLVFANLWLFKPLLLAQLSRQPGTNALVRSTQAATMVEGSMKENVLPTRARGLVNFRILPGDTQESIVAHVREVVNNPEVRVRAFKGQNASPISCYQCAPYKTIARTIQQIFPNTLVAPSITVGATDARHYAQVADQVYRFAPQHIGPDDRARFHGLNERVGVDNLADGVRFYRQLLLNVDTMGLKPPDPASPASP